MLVGLDTYSYHIAFGTDPAVKPRRPMDMFELMDRLGDLELSGCQIDPMHWQNLSRRDLQAVRREADARHLFIECGAMGISKQEIEKGLRAGAILGARILRCFLGFNRFSRETDVQQELDNAAEAIRSVLRLVEQEGIKLAIENHGDVRSRELVALVAESDSPHVGICLDTGNSLCVLEDPLKAAEQMAPYAFSTHFKDCAIVGTASGCKIVGTALGEGMLPLPELYRVISTEAALDRLLIEIPFDAAAGGREAIRGEDRAVRESVRYCRETLGIGRL
ncbi:sugar phosphate isomerase/epimerase [bacterium]|nr:MAG: sugar phosphate isomerase/epimerase [bacterium]